MNGKDFFVSFLKDPFSFYPDNKAYHFIVELPERINLVGKWEVGLCDF